MKKWINDKLGSEENHNWPFVFVNIYENIFGRSFISVKFIFMSIVASSIAVISLSLLWLAIDYTKAEKIIFSGNVWMIFFLATIWNIPADYFSLAETRIVMKQLSNKNITSLRITYYLIVDFLLTTTIFLIFYCTVNLIFGEFSSGIDHLSDALILKGGWSDTPSVGIFLYSTYFTSLWLWLFGLSGLIAKLSQVSINILRKSKNFLNFDKFPFRSIGFLSMILVTLFYCVAPFI